MKKKTINIILTAVLLLSLIPIYYVGQYAHPSVDDYYYGVETSAVWQNTHSAGAVISQSYDLMKDTYNDWQGNFAAIFLMRLQPGIFGEQYYVIAPVILITTFVISMFLFIYTLLRRWFKAGRTASVAVGTVLTFAALQFTYKPSDSFYWYNGAIYYTFFFSLMLFLFTSVITIIKSENTTARVICSVLSMPLAFVIGGGNYATALFTSIILVLLTAWQIKHKDKSFIILAVITVLSLVSLGISVMAPGNAIRQASVGAGPGVLKALVYSFAYGAYNIADSTTFPVAVMWIALLPVFYRIAVSSGLKFRFPAAAIIFFYCVYCAQGTPVFYAQGIHMPYRMMNIIYFAYYGFMTISLIYLMGWIHERFGNTAFVRGLSSVCEIPRRFTTVFSISLILFTAGCVGLISVEEADDGSAYFSGLPLSLDAVYSVMDGEAGYYDSALTTRAEYLASSDDPNAILPQLLYYPSPIYHTDITTDAADWKSAHLALYYNKTSVRLSEQEIYYYGYQYPGQ